MQLVWQYPVRTQVDVVSILIRPEGRMQPYPGPAPRAARCWFQSSSGQKAGCNSIWPEGVRLVRHVFQSSSGQKAGCNYYGSPVPVATGNCFNPHPARRPDATRYQVLIRSSPGCFNPHPARRPDATLAVICGNYPGRSAFQSSSGQKAGCNIERLSAGPGSECFNPHPARRPDATLSSLRPYLYPRQFQSSSGQKAGCNTEDGTLDRHLQLDCFNPHPARRPDATSRKRSTSRH